MKPELECLACGWQGEMGDLEYSEDDEKICPECGEKDHFHDSDDYEDD